MNWLLILAGLLNLAICFQPAVESPTRLNSTQDAMEYLRSPQIQKAYQMTSLKCLRNNTCPDSNLICVRQHDSFKGRCYCPPERPIFIKPTSELEPMCHKEVDLGGTCYNSQQCHENELGSYCTFNNKCQCGPDYLQIKNTCKRKVGIYSWCEEDAQCILDECSLYLCKCYMRCERDYGLASRTAMDNIVTGVVLCLCVAATVSLVVYLYKRFCRGRVVNDETSVVHSGGLPTVTAAPIGLDDHPPAYEQLIIAPSKSEAEPPPYDFRMRPPNEHTNPDGSYFNQNFLR